MAFLGLVHPVENYYKSNQSNISNQWMQISDGSVNSHSRKIYTWKQLLAFQGITFHFRSELWIPLSRPKHVTWAISLQIMQKFTSFSLKITQTRENYHLRSSLFTQFVKHEITFTLNSRKFSSHPITKCKILL